MASKIVTAGLVAGAVTAGLFLWPGADLPWEDGPATATAPAAERDAPQPLLGMGRQAWARPAPIPNISDIAELAVQSVVNIASENRVDRESSPYHSNPFFRRRFGPGERDGSPRHQKALGSGVIVTADGIVLTNNHVVEKARSILVTLADGRDFQAKIVGTDPKSDVAVLQLQGKLGRLVPIKFGDSGALRLGESVLAIGNPFGVGQTVTMGIVSATGRADVGILAYEDFIQTDAAINPGNSGGALVNNRGELVGINTAILSRTGGYQGIGFAIPSLMARSIMASLIKHGRVVRGWLGVAIQDVDQKLAEALQLESSSGVLLAEVMDGSPAFRAGLRQGDVVIGVSGRKVDSPGRLRSVIASHGAGSRVDVKLVRSGTTKLVAVTLGELPDDGKLAQMRGPARDHGRAGLELTELTSALRRRFRVPKRVRHGIVVSGVANSSVASRAGFRAGDIIVQFNRKSVGSIKKFRARLAKQEGRSLVLVYRGGSTIYLTMSTVD